MSDSAGGTAPSPLKKKSSKTLLIVVVAAVIVVALIGVVVLGGFLNAKEPVGLEKIKAQGKIIMWTEASFAPFEMNDLTNQTIKGFDIDLAEKIRENVSKELGVPIALEVLDRQFSNIPAALKNNQIDMSLSGMTITDERNKSVLFSTPYYRAEAGYGLLTLASTNDITNIDDIVNNGKNIVVNTGTTSEIWVQENLIDAGRVSADKVKSLPTIANCVQDVKSGYSDVFIIDNPTVDTFVAGDNDLKNAGLVPLPDEPYGVAMNLEATDLKVVVDRVITEMLANGEMDALREKWGLN